MHKPGHHFTADLGFTGSARGFAKGGAVKAALKSHLARGKDAHPDPQAISMLAKGGAPRLRMRPAKGDMITNAPAPTPISKVMSRVK